MLSLRYLHLTGADLLVQESLHPILLVKPGPRFSRLGPQVLDGVVASELERDEVVDLERASA